MIFQKEVKLLAQEIRQTDKPTKKLLQNFELAKRKSAKAKQAFIKKRDSLHQLRIELQKAGVNTRKFATEQKGLIATINQLKIAEDKFTSSLRKRQALQNQRNQARYDLVEGAAMAASLGFMVKPAIDFEVAMSDVAKVVNFTSKTAFKSFAEDLKNLSRTIPLTASELAQIAAEGGRLGLAEKDILKFVETTAKMSTAFDLLPSEVGNAIAKLSNIFDIKIPDIEHLGDAINQLGNNTAATERDIISVLTRVGGTAKQFGLSAKETAALADAFLALGKPPEIAATSINALLLKLQTAKTQSKDFRQTLVDLGIDLNQLATDISTNPQQAITQFLQTLKKLDKQSQAETLAKLFGQECSDDIALLVGSLGKYEQALSLIANQEKYNGQVNQEFQKRLKTTQAQLQLLRNAITETAINVGNSLLPAINDLAQGISTVSHGMAELINRFPNLTKYIMLAVSGLITLKVTAIALKFVFLMMKGGIASASTALITLTTQLTATSDGATSLNTRLLLLTRSFSLLKGAVAGFFAALAGYDLGKWISDEFEVVDKAGVALASSLFEAFTQIKYFFKKLGVTIAHTLSYPLTTTQEKLSQFLLIYAKMAEHIPKIGEDLKTQFEKAANAVKPAAAAIDSLKHKLAELDKQKQIEIKFDKDSFFSQFQEIEEKHNIKQNKIKQNKNSKPSKSAIQLHKPKKLENSNSSKQHKQNLLLLKDNLERQKALLDQQYNDQLIAFKDYYQKRATIEKQALDLAIKAKHEALKIADDKEKHKINQELKILENKKIDIDRQSKAQLFKDHQALQDEIFQLQNRLLNAQGKTSDSRLLQLHVEFDKVIKKLKLNGETEGVEIARKLFNVEVARIQFDQLEQEHNQLINRMKTQEESIQKQQSSGVSEVEIRRQILDLHQQTNTEIEILIPKLEEQARLIGNPELLQHIEQMKNGIQSFKETALVSAEQINQQFAGGMTNAIGDFISGTQSAKEAFKQFAADFLKNIAQMIIQQSILNAMKNSAGGGIGGFLAAAVNHTGGVVGNTQHFRKIPAIAFAGAPNYHSGGIAGLKSDEVPSILQRGEEVLKKNDPRHRNNAGQDQPSAPQPQTNLRIVNVIDPSLVQDFMSSSGGEQVILNILQRNKQTVKQVRGSGISGDSECPSDGYI